MTKTQATTPSLQLDAQIMSFLGISQQPFTSSILSGDDIYSDATRDQMIATLRHHMQFSDLVLVVEGEQGSGKTTLFRQLIQNNLPNLFLISILAEATDTLTLLQQKMVAHLKGQGSTNYLDQDLKNLQVFDQFPIAIIDDAHVLSDTTLQELIRYRSQLKHDKETNLKILLLANPGMAATLEDISDLQHNQLYVQQMPTLTPKQTQAFLDHRLNKAGYSGDALLPPETIQQIHKKSQGKPGQVMAMAALMIEKHVRNFNQRGGTFLNKFLGVASTLLLLATGIYFWSTHTATVVPEVAIMQPAPEVGSAITDELDVLSEKGLAITESETNTSVADSLAANDPAANTLDATATPAESAALPSNVSSSGIAPPPSAPVTAVPDTTAPVNTAAAATPAPAPAPASVIVTKKPVAEPRAIPSPPLEPKPALPPVVDAKAIPAEKPIIPPAPPELATLGLKDSEWLRAQDPAHWTLQLLGARDTHTLVKYVREHKLSEDCAWYATQLNGKPWYVLVYRFYTNADSARKGLDLLPAAMQQGQPWVKSLAAIQKDLPKPR